MMPSTRSNHKQPHSWKFQAIGTEWAVETPGEIPDAVKDRVRARIDDFDKAYSRFRDDSLVARAAEEPGRYEFPEDAVTLVELYRKLYEATGGAVTPLVGDTLSALGYDKDYSLLPGESVAVPDWDKVMEWDGPVVTMKVPAMLDFGAAGKGYLVDEIASLLEDENISEYVIDASGDVKHRGVATQVIGLENPFDTTMVIGVASVRNASLCASATNRRRWGDGLHHVVDGRTGKPTSDVIATWAVAASTALADGVATALFFVPAEMLASIGKFQYVCMFADGHIEHSDNFVGEFFL